jgi:phosphoribosylglycinamide formyltransferase 1
MPDQYADKIRIAIFCSGGGSNAAAIMEYFAQHPSISVGYLLANKAGIGALEKAEAFGVPQHVFTKAEFSDGTLLQWLQAQHIDLIVLAGFLWLVPAALAEAYANRVINIHPALLPTYGGKGMYGLKVHQAVLEAGEEASGISIHLVNDEYDAGAILFQESISLEGAESAEDIADRVLKLEHYAYPRVIESWVLDSGLFGYKLGY